MYSVCLSSGSICALSTVEVGHFCRFGAENGQIWPLETGYGRNPPTNRCSVFTGDYGRDVWPLVDPLTPYLRYPISAPVIRRFVWWVYAPIRVPYVYPYWDRYWIECACIGKDIWRSPPVPTRTGRTEPRTGLLRTPQGAVLPLRYVGKHRY